MIEPIKLNKQNNLKYLYNTRKYLFWAGFLVLLMVVMIFSSLVPQFESITKNYNIMIKENRRLAQLRIKVAQLDQTSGSLVFTNAEKINQALPSKKPLLELLTGLSNVGNKARVSFTDIALSPGTISTESAQVAAPTTQRKGAAAPRSYDRLSLDVTVTGPISNINQFLADIENIAPFSTVTALSLNEASAERQVAGTQEAFFEAKLTVSTFFFTREVSAKIDAAIPEITPAQREVVDALQKFTYTSVEQQSVIKGGGLQNLFPGIGAVPISL